MHQILAFALGLEVTAVRFVDVGVERAHVQQARHSRLAHGLDDAAWQLHVGVLKQALAFLVEYADQVDDAVHARQHPLQFVAVVGVGLQQLDRGADAEFAMTLRMPCQHGDGMSEVDQSVHQVLADKAGATEHAES